MRVFIFLLGGLLLFSCRDAKKGYQTIETDTTTTQLDPSLMEGKNIVENECYICHDPQATESSVIAPPLFAVKSFYIGEKTTKKEFTRSLQDWLDDPRPDKVRMQGALRRFGIMPYQPYSKEAIARIASYLYEAEIPLPEWYAEHMQMGYGRGADIWDEESVENEDVPYIPGASYYREKGIEISARAQGILGKNLVKAIQEKGTEGAIAFCQVRATGLTDSVGIMNNVIVKRVSDKPRNPKNIASQEEKGYIIAFGRQIENQALNQGEIWPIIKEMNNDEVYYYSPIVTNAMCLQCHGTPGKEIQEPVIATLRSLYPEDKAVGYQPAQVRGMWKIQFVRDIE
jgi:cytochrome c553